MSIPVELAGLAATLDDRPEGPMHSPHEGCGHDCKPV